MLGFLVVVANPCDEDVVESSIINHDFIEKLLAKPLSKIVVFFVFRVQLSLVFSNY
jgi:hypothetical protein